VFPEIQRRPHGVEIELPGVSETLARIYAARGVKSADDLDYELERIPRPDRLSGVETAVRVFAETLGEGSGIVIVGDYDADGATSCALAVRALRGFGAGEVHTKVPNRFEDGYGLTPKIVESVAPLGAKLLLTVDNGIASLDGVRAAQEAGMRVVVTDHHLPGPELPSADAVINPNQPGDESGLGSIAGVGVVFFLMVALRSHLRQSGWFERSGRSEPNLADLLDLVALGTVADVVPLGHTNRLLVHQGVRRLRAGRCQPGLKALAEVGGRRLDVLRAVDLGFVLGPRLNAAGRLEDMSKGVDCLLADAYGEALRTAKELDELNRERRRIEAKMEREALEVLEKLSLGDPDGLPAGLCLWDEGWHQGVVGIVASRLKERVHRPVVAFAPTGADELRGSARSVNGVHIRDVIENIANGHPNLIPRFGGHAMAAGLSLDRADFDRFRGAFEKTIDELLPPEQRRGLVETDGELEEAQLDLPLAEEIGAGGPWGTGFVEPIFDGRFDVVQRRIVGGRHLKMTVRTPGGHRPIEAIAFRQTDEDWPAGEVSVEMVYRLEVNEYQGIRRPQLVVQAVRLV
jgi:single-stranded-DNA-specific exonuclease